MRELSGLSDLILLGMVAEKDEAALREIVERHSPWLLLRLLRKTPDRDLAHEALHDTFVAVWKRPRSFRGDGDVGAWLWGIAIRQLVSRLRKRVPRSHAGVAPRVKPRRACCSPPSSSRWRRSGRSSDLSATT